MLTAFALLAYADATGARVTPLCGANAGGPFAVEVVECLERTVRDAPDARTRKDASQALIDDAYARDDRSRWGVLTRRHLEEIESDADLAYRYALYLGRWGPSAEPEMRRWFGVAVSRVVAEAEARQAVVDRLVATTLDDAPKDAS